MNRTDVIIPLAYNAMAKPVGSTCNLNCTYCYYLEKEKLYPAQGRMDPDLLEKYIRQHIEGQNVPDIQFVWQGGEPSLARIDFYREVVRLQKKYAAGKTISNAFQTNGLLLNDEWCRFLASNGFLVGLSLDGPKKYHDHYRRMKGGQPTFSQVMQSLSLLVKHRVEFNTLTTVNAANSAFPLEVYRFLKEAGSRFMQFIPVVEREAQDGTPGSLRLVEPAYAGAASVTEWSVKPSDYGTFMCTIFDEWVRNDVGRYYVQLFDTTLANWMGSNPGLCVFKKTCGDAVVIESNGDVYSCDHFVYPPYLLGNIRTTSLLFLAKSERQLAFGEKKWSSLPKQCKECEYCFACYGECPKHRFETTDQGEPGLNYLCPSYKKFFGHVHPFMQYMSDELKQSRPPANVMQAVRNGFFSA